jgi:EPS-associated MarR family transcriptional regulator
MDDELRYNLLRLLEQKPGLSQRDIASSLNLSLGKVNYCLRALVEKGFLKARNFRNNRNKFAYLYLLTPTGIEEKARVTYEFLRLKSAEIGELRREIDMLRQEMEANMPQVALPRRK